MISWRTIFSWEVFDIQNTPFGSVGLNQVEEGLVLLGCGGDLREWIEGVTQVINDEGIAKGSVQELWGDKIYKLITTGGRVDLLLPMKGNFNLSRMAIWRLQFGDASWWSDYRENYKDQHRR